MRSIPLMMRSVESAADGVEPPMISGLTAIWPTATAPSVLVMSVSSLTAAGIGSGVSVLALMGTIGVSGMRAGGSGVRGVLLGTSVGPFMTLSSLVNDCGSVRSAVHSND